MAVNYAQYAPAGFTLFETGANVIKAGEGFRQTEKERLAELERKAALGTLGLTSAEEEQLSRQILSPAQALARQQAIETRALLAGAGGASGGAGFQSMLASQEAEQRRIAEAAAKVAEADFIKRQKQEAEILALQQAEDTAKANRRAAILGGIADFGGTLFGSAMETRRLREMTGTTRGNAESDYQSDILGD